MKARDHVLASAERIVDPAAREVYLRAVPENARALALALAGEAHDP